MKTESQYSPDRKEILEAFSLVMRAAAKVSLEYGIKHNEAVSILKNETLKEARKRESKSPISTIGILSGINRKFIPAIESDDPLKVEDSLTLKAFHVISILKEEQDIDVIPLKGHITSLKTIVDDLSKNQESYLAVLDEAERWGCLKREGDQVRYISKRATFHKDPIFFIKFVGQEMVSLADTAKFNFNTIEFEKTIWQRSRWTKNIPIEHHETVYRKSLNILRKTHEEVDEVFKEYEEKSGNVKKSKMGTHPRFGLMMNWIMPEELVYQTE